MTAEKKKLPALQGLRGLAILAIMASHANLISNVAGKNMLESLGGFGVECFLLLTGYLMSHWHLESGIAAVTMREKIGYAMRKLRRYYSLHIVMLIVALPLAAKSLYHGSLAAWVALPLNILLLQNWVPRSSVYFSYNGVSWYLSLQLALLVMAPGTLQWLGKLRRRSVVSLFVGILLLQWILALTVTNRMPAQVSHWLVYVLPLTRWFDFVLGGLLYRFLRDFRSPRVSLLDSWLMLLTFMAIVPMALSTGGGTRSEIYSVALWSLPCLIILRHLVAEPDMITSVFSSWPMVWLGNISFELFLIHQMVLRYVEIIGRKVFGQPALDVTGSLIAMAIAIALSAGVHEYRSHRIRDRK